MTTPVHYRVWTQPYDRVWTRLHETVDEWTNNDGHQQVRHPVTQQLSDVRWELYRQILRELSG